MKKYIFKTISFIALLTMIISCRKEAALNVDLTKYNVDNPVANTDLDAWLKTTFLDEYNMDVIYRYSKYYYDNDKNVAPSNINSVRPQMQTVLDGFILPYRKVAGVTFIKKNVPKEWVMYGSGAYQTDGSMILATASAGRRVTIYDINNFDATNSSLVVGKLKTIHHEFTHILNQLVPMPADFQNITKSTYNATWTTVADATARDNGYVTPYASSEAVEDFAETTSHLLVFGQAWFDARANAATAVGKAALKAKEASVVQYFTINLGIDFRKLQQEIQNVVRNQYKYPQASFPYWMGQNLFKTMTINLATDPVYTNYGIGANFSTLYNNMKTAINSLPGYGLTFNSMKLNFTSATAMNVEISFNQGTTALLANYAYSTNLNATTGQTKFTVAAVGGTTAPWVGNATLLKPSVQPMLDYLANNTFVADWMPATINADNFNKYGGFYVSGTPTNYFYGLLGQ